MGRAFSKSEGEGDFILAPEGSSFAVLTVLAYLGKHESTWQGQTRTRELVGLAWELADRAEEDGRALSVTEVLTASLHEKAKFFGRVLALCGGREPPPGFDLEQLLGHGAIVTVAHEVRDGKTWANVSQVGPLPRGMTPPQPSITPIYFDIEAPEPGLFELLPARFRKLIETARGTSQATPPPRAPAPASQAAQQASYQAQHPAPPAAISEQASKPPTPPPPPAAPAPAPFDDDIPF